MLQVFSWQDFVLAAIVLSMIWYAGVWLLFYRGRSAGSDQSLAHRWDQDVDALEDDDSQELMGKPQLEHGVSVLSAEEFSFALAEGDRDADPVDMLGPLADVQQEIKSICGILEKEDGSKEDFFALFEVIRSKYPKVASSGLLTELNEFIREHVPFHLSEGELESLWL